MQVTRIVEVKGGSVILTHEDKDIKACMTCQGFYFQHTYKGYPVSSMTEGLAQDFYECALKYLKGE